MMKYKDMLFVNIYRINLPRIQINIVILLWFIYIYVCVWIGQISKEHMDGVLYHILVNVWPSLIVRMNHFI